MLLCNGLRVLDDVFGAVRLRESRELPAKVFLLIYELSLFHLVARNDLIAPFEQADRQAVELRIIPYRIRSEEVSEEIQSRFPFAVREKLRSHLVKKISEDVPRGPADQSPNSLLVRGPLAAPAAELEDLLVKV